MKTWIWDQMTARSLAVCLIVGQCMTPLTAWADGAGCAHVHTEECYEAVERCVHRHGAECYPSGGAGPQTATPSDSGGAEPTECTHICDEAGGCITRQLACRHEHDESCGYQAVTGQDTGTADKDAAGTGGPLEDAERAAGPDLPKRAARAAVRQAAPYEVWLAGVDIADGEKTVYWYNEGTSRTATDDEAEPEGWNGKLEWIEGSAVLTLDGAQIPGSEVSEYGAGIYCPYGLKLILAGEDSAVGAKKQNTAKNQSYAVAVGDKGGDLEIVSKEGTALSASVGDVGTRLGYAGGIQAWGAIRIAGDAVVTGRSQGADTDSSRGIAANGDITVTGQAELVGIAESGTSNTAVFSGQILRVSSDAELTAAAGGSSSTSTGIGADQIMVSENAQVTGTAGDATYNSYGADIADASGAAASVTGNGVLRLQAGSAASRNAGLYVNRVSRRTVSFSGKELCCTIGGEACSDLRTAVAGGLSGFSAQGDYLWRTDEKDGYTASTDQKYGWYWWSETPRVELLRAYPVTVAGEDGMDPQASMKMAAEGMEIALTGTAKAEHHIKWEVLDDKAVVAGGAFEMPGEAVSVKGIYEACGGGTASCMRKAVCSVCRSEYGEPDVENHEQEAEWTSTADTHRMVYPCCQTVAVAEEAHVFSGDTCTKCGFVRPGSDEPGGQPGDKPGDEPGDEPGGQPGDKPDDEPGDEPGGQPGDKPGDEPGDEPGGQPDDKPGDEPGDEPGGQPGDKPGDEPGDEPGGQPGDEPGEQPDDKPDDEPGEQPAEQPAVKPKSSGGSWKDKGGSSPGQPQARPTAEGGGSAYAGGSWQAAEGAAGWKYRLPSGQAASDGWFYLENPYSQSGKKAGWFCFDGDGELRLGWIRTADGGWYYTDPVADGDLGAMKTGWHEDPQDHQRYYLDPATGKMYVGWQLIDGRYYYFAQAADVAVQSWSWDSAGKYWRYDTAGGHPYGSMYRGERTPDGYQVDENGVWTGK